MIYNKLDNLDKKISVLGLGTEQFARSWGKKISHSEIQNIFSAAFDKGINHIDTAECYGDHLSENLIGELINNKEKWIIATKFGHFVKKNLHTEAFDLNSVKLQLDRSLKSIRRDYIDIYYFHSGDDKSFFNDELWSFLNKEVKKGKIKNLGLSLKHDLVLKNNLQQIQYLKKYGITFIQTVFNYLDQTSSKSVFDECKKNNIDIIGRMPLAKGLLTGKYLKEDDFNNDDPRKKFINFNKKSFKIISSKLREIPKNELSKWSISWVLSNPNIVSSVVGCQSIKQLSLNIDSINYKSKIFKL